jgi:hypothetical protein
VDHTLKDIYRPHLQLNTGYVPGGPEQIQLFLHPELAGPCHPIPTLAATIDGKPMTRLHGKVEGPEGYDRDCAVFEFTIDAGTVTQGPSTVVTVTDGTDTFTMEVANIFAKRTLTPSATDVKPGESVTFAWSPAGDAVDPKADIGFTLTAGDKRVVLKRKDIVFGAGTLTFTVPADLTGDVSVQMFGMLGISPAVTRCEGAHACAVSREYDVDPVVLHVKG